jgi:hypothetical protein
VRIRSSGDAGARRSSPWERRTELTMEAFTSRRSEARLAEGPAVTSYRARVNGARGLYELHRRGVGTEASSCWRPLQPHPRPGGVLRVRPRSRTTGATNAPRPPHPSPSALRRCYIESTRCRDMRKPRPADLSARVAGSWASPREAHGVPLDDIGLEKPPLEGRARSWGLATIKVDDPAVRTPGELFSQLPRLRAPVVPPAGELPPIKEAQTRRSSAVSAPTRAARRSRRPAGRGAARSRAGLRQDCGGAP